MDNTRRKNNPSKTHNCQILKVQLQNAHDACDGVVSCDCVCQIHISINYWLYMYIAKFLMW